MAQGRSGSRYKQPLYLRSRLSFTTLSPLECASLGKMGTLHKFPLVFENTPFPGITAIFLNNFFTLKVFLNS